MFEFKKGLAIISIAATLMVGAITGCTPARKPLPPSNTPPRPETVPGPNRKPLVDPMQQSRKAVSLAKQVPGVKGAVAASSGSMVYVGITTNTNTRSTSAEGIKRDVANRIKNNDRSIKSVLVTSDPKLVTRIRNISQSVANGKPVSGFTKEFNDLSKRISPLTK